LAVAQPFDIQKAVKIFNLFDDSFSTYYKLYKLERSIFFTLFKNRYLDFFTSNDNIIHILLISSIFK